MCAQWRLWSDCASAKSDQSLRCPHELCILGYLAISNATSENSDQTMWKRRLIWVFTWRTWPTVLSLTFRLWWWRPVECRGGKEVKLMSRLPTSSGLDEDIKSHFCSNKSVLRNDFLYYTSKPQVLCFEIEDNGIVETSWKDILTSKGKQIHLFKKTVYWNFLKDERTSLNKGHQEVILGVLKTMKW